MRYAYPCVLNPEEDGGFFVVFPDVPGALTCGDARAEALEMAADALVAILATHVHNGEDLPTPSSAFEGQEVVAVPPVPAAKLALYSAMREQGLSQAALAEQLGLDEASVGQLLDPDRYSHISRVTNALRAVGRSLVVEDRVA